MKIALLADIHNDAQSLARVVDELAQHDVDQFVTLGDTIDLFAPVDGSREVAELLSDLGAIGVWGNHDFNLCRDVSDFARDKYDAQVLRFLARMEPQLLIGDFLISHKELTGDPHDVEFLWSFEEEPMEFAARASLAFEAVTDRCQFVGHYHRWFAATADGPLDWHGDEPLLLADDQRYFVVVAPVFNGQCGLLDTDSNMLLPISMSNHENTDRRRYGF